jgi:uncharacterized protein YjbI with pentapeptide repeats
MKLRPVHALAVAVLALVLAMAGTSYAGLQIASGQIKNNSIKSKDIKDGQLTGKDVKDSSLTGADVQDGSITKADLAPSTPSTPTCTADQFRLATGCLIKAVRPGGPTTINAALTDCNSIGGRLPTLNETKLLPLTNALTSGVTWADGNTNQYEFTGAFQQNGAFANVVSTDFGGNVLLEDGVTLLRRHHCVVDPK